MHGRVRFAVEPTNSSSSGRSRQPRTSWPSTRMFSSSSASIFVRTAAFVGRKHIATP